LLVCATGYVKKPNLHQKAVTVEMYTCGWEYLHKYVEGPAWRPVQSHLYMGGRQPHKPSDEEIIELLGRAKGRKLPEDMLHFILCLGPLE